MTMTIQFRKITPQFVGGILVAIKGNKHVYSKYPGRGVIQVLHEHVIGVGGLNTNTDTGVAGKGGGVVFLLKC